MANPASDDIESQLNGPQRAAAGQRPGSAQNASQVEPFSEQPSPLLRTEEPAQPEPDTVKLQPPPPTARGKKSIIRSMEMSLGLAGYSWSRSWEEEAELTFCARKRKSLKTQNMKVGPVEVGHSHTRTHPLGYIVVGIMGNEESIPHETLLPILGEEDLYNQIRKAERELRHPFRRLLSLKRVGGFGIYRCHPSQDYHSNPAISNETTRCLVELYRNYRTEEKDYRNRWMNWIHKNFNNESTNPTDGKYALQLLLRWSPLKLIIWSSILIIFRLVIGLWYMIHPHPGEDYVAVVQTAWTIASYIVTTAALVLAIIASITQLGDV